MRTVFKTFGCRLNQSETEILQGQFRKNGFEIMPEDTDLGDFFVINTCTVTLRSDNKCKQEIRKIQRKNPGAQIAVVGCYSQMASEEISEIGGIDYIVGNQRKFELPNYVSPTKNEVPLILTEKISSLPFTLPQQRYSQLTRANLKIQDGCNFFCSFCIIPMSRGRSRPRILSDLVDEAKKVSGLGAKELILTGVNLGTYQYEGNSLLTVIDSLEQVDGVERIRISSIEPTTVEEGILSKMADPNSKLVPFLHLPIQSASDKILSKMRRKYLFNEYEDFVLQAKKNIPDLQVGSDVMVGFPGESEEDFKETYENLEKTPVDFFHVFSYSERKNTLSVKIPDKVSIKVKNRRSLELRNLSDKKRQAFARTFIGKKLRVLLEEKTSGNTWMGYSENYVRFKVGGSDDLKKNDIVLCSATSEENGVLVSNVP